MALLKILAKELAETLIRNFKKLIASSHNTDLNIKLKKDGLVKVSNFYNTKECKRLRDKIDSYIQNDEVNVWKDECGADNRIYFINEIDKDFNDFYEHPEIREALKNYTGLTNPQGMLLAARIDAKEGNVGSGGGWHRDSPISHQFKAICYLSDVSSSYGPFMYIKGSHSKLKIIKLYLKRVLKPGVFRFSNNEIKQYLVKSNQKVIESCASEGTVMFADTKGIHRGKPIAQGSRYVLFCYFWSGAIPEHFSSLRQR